MSVVAMNSCTRDSPTAMINDRNDPMHQGGALRTRSKRLAIAGWDSYPHPKVLMSVAIRVRVRQAPGVNRTTTTQMPSEWRLPADPRHRKTTENNACHQPPKPLKHYLFEITKSTL